MRAAKATWEGKHDKSLVARVRSELHGANEALALELLKGERDELSPANTTLAANQAVGDLFRAKGLPTIYRVHPEKDPEEIERVAAMLSKFGIRVPDKDRLTGRDIGRMIRLARRKRERQRR